MNNSNLYLIEPSDEFLPRYIYFPVLSILKLLLHIILEMPYWLLLFILYKYTYQFN